MFFARTFAQHVRSKHESESITQITKRSKKELNNISTNKNVVHVVIYCLYSKYSRSLVTVACCSVVGTVSCVRGMLQRVREKNIVVVEAWREITL